MKKEILLKEISPDNQAILKEFSLEKTLFVTFNSLYSKLICIEDAVVGIISILEEEDIYEIKIAVKPEYQGKGIATYVIEMVANNVLKRNSNAKLMMLVDEENLPSIRLANKLGFDFKNKNDANELVFMLDRNKYLKQE